MKVLPKLTPLAGRLPYICTNCLSRSRAVTQVRFLKAKSYATSSSPPPTSTSAASVDKSETPRPPNPPPPPKTGYSRLTSRQLISLSGRDAGKYLNGVTTQNFKNLPAGNPNGGPGGYYAAFLNAQGRVLNDVFVYKDFLGRGGSGGGGSWNGEDWLVEVDAMQVEVLKKHIERFKLRSKFSVRILDRGEKDVWGVWGKGVEGDGWNGAGLVGCVDSRGEAMGRRVVLDNGQSGEGLVEGEEVSLGTYMVKRILEGIPEGQLEIVREVALPQESCIDRMGGIDYRKGCYVGQELTIRTHHTGVVRKRFLPVMLYENGEEIPKKLVYDPSKYHQVTNATAIGRAMAAARNTRRPIGNWITGVGNIGLASCTLGIMTDVETPGDESAGTYKEGDEFKIQWGEGDEGRADQLLKVKAFVPDWHSRQM